MTGAHASRASITGVGMITSVGTSAAESCAAVRGDISGVRELEFQPLSGAMNGDPPGLYGARAPVEGIGVERVPRLFQAAMRDLVQSAALPRAELDAAAFFVALPEPLRGGADDFLAKLAARTAIRCRLRFGGAGHAAAISAIEEAVRAIENGEVERAIVAGIESYDDWERLEALDAAGRLKSDLSPDGFAPGEAAAVLLIEAGGSRKPLATIEAVASAVESHPLGSGGPITATALSKAIRSVSAGGPLSWTVCDLNGESRRAREWGTCRARLVTELAERLALWHPADCLGDTGSATGVVLACIAARALEKGYAPAGRALVWASSDDGERGALVLKHAS